MAIKLTEEQLAVTFRYIARRLQEDGVPLSNVGEVVKWMILNPLPTRKELESEQAKADEREKQRRIQLLTEELTKLEGN